MSGAAVGTGSDDDGRVHRVHGGRASSWRNRYKESRPPIFKTGGLGPWMQPHHYEMCGCIYDHYCSNHPTDSDKFFCWVRDETKAKNGEVAPDQYVLWNHNANLEIVEA